MQGLSPRCVGWRRAFLYPATVRRHPVQASRTAGTLAERQWQSKHTAIETLTAKWQPHWDRLDARWNQLRVADKGTAYVLPMFPYPSGTLHLGHLRVYTISDVLARFKHMQGYDVLHPIAWDAFGLPAENAAIERGVHPEKWTLQNIETMKTQIKQMGGRWNWSAEFRTCDPAFYKHTQRIFLMLHERGLAYQAESLVNYDPVDKTVLANEQVDANGCSWRSGAKVEKVMLKQWFLKIKEFQEPLLEDLDALTEDGKWPEKVIAMQRNWIGKSEGVELPFNVKSTTGHADFEPLSVFTTRADTLFGVQYIALSLQHPVVQKLAAQDESLRAFIDRAKDAAPDSKESFLLPNLVAMNPLATSPKETIPIYVAPYVLSDYGTGAVMGVPGHDTRDHAFWRQNAGSAPIKIVVTSKPETLSSSLVPGGQDKPFTEKGFVADDVHRFGSLPSGEAMTKIIEEFDEKGLTAKKAKLVHWRLRDWLISRQRYWGTPIPIVHCGSCGSVPVPEKDLPVELPSLPDSFFEGMKGNPLAEDENWKKTECPKCGSLAERETDTMDTFMDSSWYFFRFLDRKNKNASVDPRKADTGMPVDLYIGGVEHAILHLLYARFISKFLATTPTWRQGRRVNGEPFRRVITQGMVHGQTFSDPETGRFLHPDEVDTTTAQPVIKASGVKPTVSFEKMSKSKYNGVDPSAIIAKHGVDATRAHMLFQAPVSDVLEWDEQKITGVKRWLHRVIRLSSAFWLPPTDQKSFFLPIDLDLPVLSLLKHLSAREILRPTPSSNAGFLTEDFYTALKRPDADLCLKTHKTIARVTDSFAQTYSLNTIISDLMTFTNTIWDTPHSSPATSYIKWFATSHLLRMLAPIAPAVAEEAWHQLTTCLRDDCADRMRHHFPTIFATRFPEVDHAVIARLDIITTCVVLVDGKRKFEVEIDNVGVDLCGNGETGQAIGYLLSLIAKTEKGKEWLDRETGRIWAEHRGGRSGEYEQVPEGWGVIERNGLVNLVSPGKKRGRGVKKDGR